MIQIHEETKLKLSVSFFLLLGVVLTLLIFFAGCISQPAKQDYSGRPNACYDFAECLYLNQKNADKSVCLPISMECRAYEKYIYCKTEKEMTFNNCWLYLNQK
jgi:hypothetical protein